MNAAKSLPKKTIVLETGFVSKGTIVPLSNSLEMLFIAVAMAKRKNPKLLAPKVIAKVVFDSTAVPVAELKYAGNTRPSVAKTKDNIMTPMNFFFRMFQSIS